MTSDSGKFTISPLEQVERFLILGTEGGTFYASERSLTIENAQNLQATIKSDGMSVIALLNDVYEKGRAARQSPTLFAYAMARNVGDQTVRKAVYERVAKFRTLSHLQEFMSFNDLFGGTWSRGLRTAVSTWFNSRPVDELSYQMAKYQNRYGYTSGDLLKLAHPWAGQNFVQVDPDRDRLYKWATGKDQNPAGKFVTAMVQAQTGFTGTSAAIRAQFVRDEFLSHEMVPTDWKNDAEVWMALLESMPLQAMVRNLGNLAKHGLLMTTNSNATKRVLASLGNADWIRKSRLHPISLLQAYLVYKSGQSVKGSGSWHPLKNVTDALDAAFYTSFGNVEPAHKKTLLALDVSGSMGMGNVVGVPGLTPRLGSAAMSLVHLATEPWVMTRGFSGSGSGFMDLEFTPDMKIEDAVRKISNLSFGSTDCSMPMTWAAKNQQDVETFIVYTDSETNSHSIEPAKALENYRQKTGIDARLIVVGMTASNYSIADPDDFRQLNVVGFDAAAPVVMNDFSRGFSKAAPKQLVASV